MRPIYTEPRDIQQDEPAARCGRCKGEVYREGRTAQGDGPMLCEDCLKEEVSALLESDPWFVASLLGYDVVRYM